VKQTNYHLNRLRRVASRPELKSKLLFSVGDLESNKWKLGKFDGIDIESSKSVSVIETDGGTFVMTDDFSEEAVKSFVADFLDGKLTAATTTEEADGDDYNDEL
jgi:hypothetical protein